GNCINPSREHPYFASGRLLSGALIPFAVVYVYGVSCLCRRINTALPLIVLGMIVVFVTTSEILLNRVVFVSEHNWFHLYISVFDRVRLETTRCRVSSVTSVPPTEKRAAASIEPEASTASSQTPELRAAGLLQVLRAHRTRLVRPKLEGNLGRVRDLHYGPHDWRL